MRIEFNENTKKYMYDIGRPSFYDEEDCLVWQKVFTYIEETNIRIQVNGIYDGMRHYAFNNGRYGGSGFSFCFWFESKPDRKQFAEKVGEIFGEKLHDYRGIRLINRFVRPNEQKYTGTEMPVSLIENTNQERELVLAVDKKYIPKLLELSEIGINFSIPDNENEMIVIKANTSKQLIETKNILEEYFYELD